ncbi:MAG TPA: MBL fold metallo-hydrolase [Candidatus Lokiarchaeia archaeon]|nr:MBL fold metallo-hydrolase [Candidatus Lokiarchaeia archaeon]
MLITTNIGPIKVYEMGRGLAGGFLFPVYAYLVDGLLIDSGATVVRSQFRKVLEREPVSVVVNTHSHEDHIGNNAMVAKLKGAQILAQASALPILANPKLLKLRGYQRFAWGTPPPSIGTPVPPEVQTVEHVFQVIETPGHTPDHVCLFEPEQGWLFSGDLHVAELSLVYQPYDHFHQILASLKRLLPLDIHTIFDAHKGVIEDGPSALNAKVDFMETMEANVMDLHEKGMPAKEISQAVLGKENFFAMITGGHMSKLNGIMSILNETKE